MELLSHAGVDFIWIDAEHSAIDTCEIQNMVRAAGSRCPAIVRVPSHDEAWIKRVLDTGCDGIVVPQVNSADEARRVLQYCYYPPRGRRSVGGTRAQAYGFGGMEYVRTANDSVAVILQVEHVDGVAAIDEIAAVEGIDAIFVGPIDLSASLGRVGELDHPEVREAVDSVFDCCRRRGVPTGIYARDADAVKAACAAGATMIAFGTDGGFLRGAVSGALQSVSGLRNR